MGLTLVVDTNVFLLAHGNSNCAQVVNRVLHGWDTMFALDTNHEIRKEYVTYAKKYPESRLRELVTMIIEMEAASNIEPHESALSFVLPMEPRLNIQQKATLEKLGCHSPIEPQMYGIAEGQSHTKVVIPNPGEPHRFVIPRGYLSQSSLEHLQNLFPDLAIVTTSNLGWLDEPSDAPPGDIATLEAFLRSNRLDKQTAEREFIELKCPETPSEGLKGFLVKGFMAAICALSNSTSGYVFVGVRDDGTIHGIPRMFNGNQVSSWDDLWNKVYGRELSHFQPRRPIFRQWYISESGANEDDPKVLAIRVERQRGSRISYRGKVYVREGTMSVCISPKDNARF